MFTNRYDAGIQLTKRLEEAGELPLTSEAVVLSIPRGGVPVGKAVADKFQLPHDCLITKKIRAPRQQELALGALGTTPASMLVNRKLVEDLNVSNEYFTSEVENRRAEILRQEKIYRAGRPGVLFENKTVIIVDDGAATGSTIISAIRQVFESKPKRVVVALPVCAFDTLHRLEAEADSVIALLTPKVFTAISEFYTDFSKVTDEEVINIMANG